MKKIDLGKAIIGNLKLTKLLKNSYYSYLEIKKDLEKDFKEYDFSSNIYLEKQGFNFTKTFKKNFFTLLMISILEKSDISKERIIKYGKILICLRTIITCTDNMIDSEEKGIIFLKGIDNNIVRNTMLLMSTQNIMNKILFELGDHDKKVMSYILNKIYSIAESESLRGRDGYEEYPRSFYIVEKIHEGIGGELLQLSLLAAEKLENNKIKIAEFNKGLFHIGIALQGLDDLCDMLEDYNAKQINLGISKMIYQLNIQENEIENELKDKKMINKQKEFYRNYLDECIDEALKGFQKFISLEYPVSEKDSLLLLKILFEIRGLGKLWEISSYNKKVFEKINF